MREIEGDKHPLFPNETSNYGYHIAEIERGEFGEPSKILEETLEFMDAVSQGVRIMELIELSDLLGAVSGYLARHHPGMTLEDLMKMSSVTQRAFRNGHRR